MAFFDERELIDVIRHEVRLEDDTGYVASIVPPPVRRAKYGGLPLHFRSSVDDDEYNEYEGEQCYQIPLYEEPIGTKKIIENRMRSRTVDSDKTNHVLQVPCVDADPTLFVKAELPHCDEKTTDKNVSVTARFVAENLTALQNPLNDYARFEAAGESPTAKKILIIFPENGDKESMNIEISVQATAKVSEVIGFCCYKYLQQTSTELLGALGEYSLYMADESGEIEMDFPPLERSRPIGDLGFPVLALVRTQKEDGDAEKGFMVTVYFTSGEKFDVEVRDPELPISWLCEQVLLKRQEERTLTNDQPIMVDAEYTIERLDRFDEYFQPDATIASTFCTEFVMVRKNSSRGDFMTRPVSGLLSQLSVLSPISPTPSTRQSGVFDFPVMTPDNPMTPVSNMKEDGFISCFVVQRMHKYKPRWRANLILRWNVLELSPFASESQRRKSFLPQKYQKETRVAWENVGGVVSSEKEREKEPVYILTFYWIPLSEAGSSKNDQEEMTLQTIKSLSYVNWKSVSVECKSREDVQEISGIVQSILQSRESAAYQAWQYSSEGLLSPSVSARSAIASCGENEPVTSSKEEKPRRFPRIVRLTRMFSIGEK